MKLKLLILISLLSTQLYSFKPLEYVLNDYSNFYSYQNLKILSTTFMFGAMFANSELDEGIANIYQTKFRTDFTNSFFGAFKFTGTYKYMLPVYIGASLFKFFDNSVLNFVGSWGTNVLRSYIVGVPLLITTQRVFGASRPIEPNGSAWHFFKDDNAVSGHSMMGSIPFLVLANMTDNFYISSVFYICSLFPGFSRINDNMHYFSQVAMGWMISYISVKSVFKTNDKFNKINVLPIVSENLYGVNFVINL